MTGTEEPDPRLRVSDAEREQVIAHLHRSTEEGRLDLSEFNDRAAEVYRVRTHGELKDLLSDLPEINRQLRASAGGVEVVGPGELESDSPALLKLTPKASTIKRLGRWRVPQRIVLKGKASNIKLNFTEAIFSSREVHIQVDDMASSIVLILPDEGVYAVDEIDLKAASVKNKVHTGPQNWVRISVTGSLSASSLKIRRQYRFFKWRW
ncbi:DUF1707 SHOCT-like domain-containing protein [Natronoglycomyces albus]|uniref:DUF1707 domain-containing protein n=1 Tax=Natronoglycomyces albus TaxID=2811108 RepID=A0A895XS75_9ACTN|nr:DUF1707 domain-containing protein [Natronoglycomyces albus]QSB05110.1 DUF1707 domain-containing protein [Natronoglycomyces albus]